MDLDEALTSIVDKESLLDFIRKLPAKTEGVFCFRVPTGETDEDGYEMERLLYRSFGNVTIADAVLLGHEIIDFARGQ